MRLVLVEWMDSGSAPQGWKFTDEGPPTLCCCQSVGWLLDEPAESPFSDVVVLYPHLGGEILCDPNQSQGAMAIPRCAITRMVDLQEKPS